ncbi:nucleoside triphosphate pyrophosphohydrolase [Sphingorhabdus sp. EL138]|uniref:nucleoside triphosphate pyrophosphohydrolase n=1 Tax=Sphingorhabdus sp. EL138 TaxID=2073156 RepID=UPI0025E94427|nr:nucleoside triphosphate pyrophosphohydrolase [Sphingorhabdus sp. EL138]
MSADITPLTDIMARLRDRETGCPWDIEQNFTTIAPYTIEEAYEVADAIERNDLDALKDELGDLLLQVVFHSQMASELGVFDIQDVVNGICDKMVRRHPHVFGDATTASHEVPDNWETIKAAERSGDEDSSALAGVALALPALLRAQKIQKRAARTGFDWPDQSGARDKIIEELEEVENASSAEHVMEELGDLLFAVVNFTRFHKVDAEQALRQASAKFERRFRGMEMSAGDAFAGLSLDAKEELWQQSKAKEQN